MLKNSLFRPNNGVVLIILRIIRAVMLSAAEMELGYLFIKAQ